MHRCTLSELSPGQELNLALLRNLCAEPPGVIQELSVGSPRLPIWHMALLDGASSSDLINTDG